MKTTRWHYLTAAALLSVGAVACSDGPTGPDPDDGARFLSVVPTGGATEVDPHGDVVIRFDHPMMPGMEAYAMLHRGEVTGPEVEGGWSFSNDHTVLTFRPHAPLEPGTLHTIHLGGGMTDAGGHPVDWSTHGPGMGGAWAGETMMGSTTGPHGGMMGGAVGTGHMGPGWQHPNGSYGMVFSFTTAG